MNPVIIYSIDEFLSYKNVSVNVLTEELSNLFDNINNSFLQSTQYIDNRKKINYNHLILLINLKIDLIIKYNAYYFSQDTIILQQ